MDICVLNGSPKGEKSVTMQYTKFLELANPDHSFHTCHISQKISILEKNSTEWEKVINAIQKADIILWAAPVYFQHVPAQYKRFIELIFEKKVDTLFSGKYAASLSTSVHFFDHKVHEYLQGISEDLDMRFVGSFSAAMEDLLQVKNQVELTAFGDDILSACESHRPVIRAYPPVPELIRDYNPGVIQDTVDKGDKRVLILHDSKSGSNLEKMVKQMSSQFSGEIDIHHLDDIGIKGGCLGCAQCAFDNQCIYTDGFCSFWENKIKPADIIVFAGTIRDRYLSSAWKQFFDRSFFLGHIPRFSGKQLIIMVQGQLASVPGLRENLSCLISGGNLVDFVTDEPGDDACIDALISSVAMRAVRYAHTGYRKPPMFPQVAGHIILRDEIWGNLRSVFRADHKYYKSHGLYDFPQYQYRKRISWFFFSLMMSIPSIQKKVKPVMKDHMIQSFTQVFTTSNVLKNRNSRINPGLNTK